jgi:hypothetical protein
MLGSARDETHKKKGPKKVKEDRKEKGKKKIW